MHARVAVRAASHKGIRTYKIQFRIRDSAYIKYMPAAYSGMVQGICNCICFALCVCQ